MKKIAMLLAVLLVLLAGCGEEPAADPTQGTAPTLRATEPEVTEAPTEPTVPATEAPTAPPATEPEFGQKFDLSSADERYRINIFLSNFSEQDFNAYTPHDYQPVTTAFRRDSAAPAQYVEFGFLWYYINSIQSLEDDGYHFSLTMDQINGKLERYFGRTLTREEFENSGFEISGERVKKMAAYGDSHPNLTIVQQMWGNGQGQYLVRYSVFTWEEITGGDMVWDKNWYYLDHDTAREDPRLKFFADGYAIVEEYHNGTVDSYHLVSYWLDGQTEP